MRTEDFIFKIFWKTKDEVIPVENGKCQLQTVIIPRFGKIGAIIWFILTHDGKWVLEEQENDD